MYALLLILFLLTKLVYQIALTASVSPTYYPSLSPYSISIISTIAGTGTGSFSGDGGQASSATIYDACGIAIDSSGNVFFSDRGNQRVRKITSSTGIITTYAGTGLATYGGDGGSATSASLNYPHGLSIDTSGTKYASIERVYVDSLLHYSLGNIYIADSYNNRVRKVTAATSFISTIAGTGSGSYSGDNGAATSAAIQRPTGIAVDSSGMNATNSLKFYLIFLIFAGNVYIAEYLNNRVRKVTAATNVITTIAGTGIGGYNGDGGQATAAAIANPHGMNLDNSLNVYFGDCCGGYNVIRKITVATGIISTVAGTGSASGGYNGDNIQATAASLNNPHDVLVDGSGNLYISDFYNYRIRKVTISTGVITTIVGTGAVSSTGDGGAASSATVNGPCYSRFDSAGNYHISECAGNRVRKVITVSTEIPTTTPSYTPR